MVFCVRCGSQNPETNNNCTNCGASLYNPAANSAAAPSAGPVSVNPAPQIPVQPYGQPQPWFTPYPSHPMPTLSDAPVLKFHPLAENTRGLPLDLMSHPQRFYSYVNAENRLVFARRSSFSNRLAAAILDLIIVGIPYFVLATVLLGSTINLNDNAEAIRAKANPVAASWLLAGGLTIFFSYFFFSALKNGQSIGKRVLRIRVMKLNGAQPDKLTIALRFLCGYMMSANLLGIAILVLVVGFIVNNLEVATIISLFAFGWGFWWSGWDELKQGWHDKLARTLVVDVNEYVEGFHFDRIPA